MTETFRHQLLDALQQLYADLQGSSGPPTSNACGTCRTCCTARGVDQQKVTELELALLARHYGDESAGRFRRFAARELDEQGVPRFDPCPNLGPEGCRVYAHRPFSCRVFGHYRLVSTRLPEGCHFQGKERVLQPADYYRQVPGAAELRQLSRDYQMLQPPSAPGLSEAAPAQEIGLNLEDELDRALAKLSQEEDAEVAPPGPDSPLFAHYVRALWAAQKGLHQEALERYQWVVARCPDRYDLKTFIGFHAFQLGQFELAERSWLESLAAAVQPLTLAFLGYLYQHQGEWQRAADFFGAAAELEPEQPTHRQRHEMALQRLRIP